MRCRGPLQLCSTPDTITLWVPEHLAKDSLLYHGPAILKTYPAILRAILRRRASELRECVTALHEFHLKAHRRGPREQSAIHEKYSQQKYHSVATILAPPDNLPAYLFEDLESPMDL